MGKWKTTAARRAFTMVELMVVIAVIALLVAILMPALATVRTNAKYAQARGQFRGIDGGIEMFRGESALGGRIPPSASDNPDNAQLIANPQGTLETADMSVAGAHLLVQAMLGADLLGTPGFVDTDGDGFWYDNTNSGLGGAGGVGGAGGPPGAYHLDGDAVPARPRYGGAGYVDDRMREHTSTLRALMENGTIAAWSEGAAMLATTGEQRLFVDPWDHPILYYRANPAARLMLHEDDVAPGIYRQEDNGIITGSTAGGAFDSEGIDFGAGANANGRYHSISVAVYPGAVPNIVAGVNDILTDADYEDSLARFILDSSVLVRNTPVRKDSYLLISAGPDGRYGTSDDVTNWTREQE